MTSEQFAQKWKTNARTIRRWKSDGAPLGQDDATMRAWLQQRSSLPPGTAMLLQLPPGVKNVAPPQIGKKQPQRKVYKADSNGQEEKGAAAALGRLEQSEAEAYTELMQLRADPEATTEAIDAAHGVWLRTSESLRRYDLAIEASRRESGSLVPREILEDYVRGMVVNLTGSVMATVEAACPKLAGLPGPAEVGQVLLTVLRKAIRSGVSDMASRPYGGKTAPDWLVKAVEEAMEAHFQT